MDVAIIYPNDLIGKWPNLTRMHLFVPKQFEGGDTPSRIRHLKSRGHYIILDNGAYEGELLDLKSLLELAKSVNANEIVLPDVFQDANKTVQSYKQILVTKELPDNCKYMLVPQGKNLAEWFTCFEQINNIWDKSKYEWVLGIPKWLAKDDPGVRAEILTVLGYRGFKQPIHLLGCNGMPEIRKIVDVLKRRVAKVRSIDTSYPIKLAQAGKKLTYSSNEKVVWDSKEYLKSTFVANQMPLIAYNVLEFINIIREEIQ